MNADFVLPDLRSRVFPHFSGHLTVELERVFVSVTVVEFGHRHAGQGQLSLQRGSVTSESAGGRMWMLSAADRTESFKQSAKRSDLNK